MLLPWASIALVDMDGVIADFERRVQELVRQQYPDVHPLSPPPNPWPFYTRDAYPKAHHDLINSITREPGFFLNLPLVQDALVGWQRIIDAGFTPRICSSPLRAAPQCGREKRQWLRRIFVPHFGRDIFDTAVITGEKWRVEGAVLIEDRPPPIDRSDHATWEQVVFDQPCNRTSASQGYIRLNGWKDPKLAEKLNLAAERAQKRHI